jgi:hypothetical protein
MNTMMETLIAYSQKKANANDVLRAMMSYRGWFVPIGFFALGGESKRKVDSMLILSAENLVPPEQLWVFTDEESARLAADKGFSVGTYAGGMAGTELFRLIEPVYQTVYINPGSPPERSWIFQEGSASTAGRLWAQAIALEEKFVQWQQTGQPDKTAIMNYPGYILFDHVTGPIVTLPNMGGMSNPAAAFTTPDCVQQFFNELSDEERASIKQVEVDGNRLLQLSSLGVDGFLFNFFGPGASYALRFDQ